MTTDLQNVVRNDNCSQPNAKMKTVECKMTKNDSYRMGGSNRHAATEFIVETFDKLASWIAFETFGNLKNRNQKFIIYLARSRTEFELNHVEF